MVETRGGRGRVGKAGSRGRPARRRGRWIPGLLLGGAVVGVPALAHALIHRRARPPRAPRWGRGHRYAGRAGDIVFQELGRGEPLLLLHSFGPGHDSGEWEAAAEMLAGRHAVFVPDLPGWARSEAPAAYRPGAYVEAIADFLTNVVGERAVIVAAGLPAAYASEVAAAAGDAVRALALVTPMGLEPESARRGAAAEAGLRRLAALPLLGATALDLLTSRQVLTHHLRHEVYAAPERVDAALVEHHYRTSHQREARRALAAYLSGRLTPPADRLAALLPAELPVWIAWGREAVQPPVACADLWLRRLPKAQIEVFEDTGGLPHAERPAAFCRAFEAFLAGL